jgi:hypothetical protein
VPSLVGNKITCRDFALYESWVQSLKSWPPQTVWNAEQRTLADRLETDGPTAKSGSLASEASGAVNAIKSKKGEQLSNQMNASELTCLNLGYPSWGSSY